MNVVEAAEAETQIRKVNELIIEVARDRFQSLNGHVMCECSLPRCREIVPLTLEAYERVRAAGRRFVLVRGHQIETIESVVEWYDDYVVAEKHGNAGRLAELNDPRA